MPAMAFRKKFENDMKVPVRPAPLLPAGKKSLYSPVTNWEDNLFEADVFEPTPNAERKKPPPRPPPPIIAAKPDIATPKPSHFIRKPTILGALLARKSKNESNYASATQTQQTDISTQMVSGKSISSSSSFSSQSQIFSSTSSKTTTTSSKSSAVHVASLIDFSSPPESPTFTTRSSSDGLSIDSFGSDATSSTNNHFTNGGGNISQTESGFEDDFDLFSSNRSNTKDDSLDGWVNFDPFSPVQLPKKSAKKSAVTNGEYLDPLCNGKTILPAVQTHKVPTIIRAKPTRPKPPENSALLKSTFTSVAALPAIMNLNMAEPIQKANNGITEFSSTSRYSDLLDLDLSMKRDSSPPMPTIPPPPPPVIEEEVDSFEAWPSLENAVPTSAPPTSAPLVHTSDRIDVLETEPYGYSVYAYHGEHDDDLNFEENVKIKLLRKVNDEWMLGRLKSGAEGMFPANYVDVKIPLAETTEKHSKNLEEEKYHTKAKALYHFVAEQAGDLPLTVGCNVTILNKVNEEWYYGERNGQKGQFPANYVQIC